MTQLNALANSTLIEMLDGYNVPEDWELIEQELLERGADQQLISKTICLVKKMDNEDFDLITQSTQRTEDGQQCSELIKQLKAILDKK